MRRLHKFYDKYCAQGYLSKIKRFLQPPTMLKRDEVKKNIHMTNFSLISFPLSVPPKSKHPLLCHTQIRSYIYYVCRLQH